jgi:hypothetical protein
MGCYASTSAKSLVIRPFLASSYVQPPVTNPNALVNKVSAVAKVQASSLPAGKSPSTKHVEVQSHRGAIVHAAKLDNPSASFNVSSPAYDGWWAGFDHHAGSSCDGAGTPNYVYDGECFRPTNGSATLEYLVDGYVGMRLPSIHITAFRHRMFHSFSWFSSVAAASSPG